MRRRDYGSLPKALVDVTSRAIVGKTGHSKAKDLKTSNEQLRALLARSEAAHEAEKSRFARTLHDDLSQKLTALLIELSLLERAFLPTSKEARKVEELSGIVSSISQSVRKMTNELRLKLLDEFGLAAAIKHQTERWVKDANIHVLISPEPDEFEMDSALAAGIFKIFQTVVRAFTEQSVTQMCVDIEDTSETFCMRISEGGKARRHKKIFADEPLELLGLHEHARRLHGELKLVKTTRNRTEVQLKFWKRTA
ncbi:MAG: signal transduction histidine kinase [Verrucomicrobiales bacterium]|nr:signal transduction histidine kinase [Verrucomicrobiales bacterium]